MAMQIKLIVVVEFCSERSFQTFYNLCRFPFESYRLFLSFWIKSANKFIDQHLPYSIIITMKSYRTFSKRVIAPFNNLRTPKFKAQLTNAFFSTVNQMFGSSSQLPTILSELYSTIWFGYQALGSSWKLGGAADYLMDSIKNAFVRWVWNIWVSKLLEGPVINFLEWSYKNHSKKKSVQSDLC